MFTVNCIGFTLSREGLKGRVLRAMAEAIVLRTSLDFILYSMLYFRGGHAVGVAPVFQMCWGNRARAGRQ